MNYAAEQAPEPRKSFRRRIRAFLVPRPDPDPHVTKRGFGWGWLVFMAVLGLALLSVERGPWAKGNMAFVMVISLPIAVLIYFRLRKWIVEKGRFSNKTWKGSLGAGIIALLPSVFVAAFVMGLFALYLPQDIAPPRPAPGLTELLLLLTLVVIVGGTALIVHLVSRRFKKSTKDRLTNGRSIAPFSSPGTAGEWTRGLLVATLGLAAVAAFSGILQIELLSRIAKGAFYTMEEATRNDSRQQLIGILQIVLLVGTGVAFLIWFHRAHKNLPSLGQRRLAFTPGWAVGFFFVPFLNFVRPFQAMRELWHGSDPGRWEPAAPSEESEIRNKLATPPLVGWWWALFLTTNLISNIAARLLLFASGPGPEVRAAGVLMVVSDLLDIPGALITIRLVGRLTRWQNEKARLISARGTQGDMVVENASSAAEIEASGRKKIKQAFTSEAVIWLAIALLFLPVISFMFMRNATRTEEPQKVFVEGQYFTVGSTREEVLRIQGAPTLKLEFVWYYDDSYVQFDSEGKVNDVWNYSKNLRVKPWKVP